MLLVYIIFKFFKLKNIIQKKAPITTKDTIFSFIVTAHQEADFIPPLIDSIIKQNYQQFEVYIVADDCQTDVIQFLDPRIHLLQPATPLHSKIKSIQFAIASFTKQPDAIVILDSDNLIHPSFLATINAYFQKGYRVVQSAFKPKNTDTNFARMDAIGDMFNFFIEREVRSMAGLSATIWGSGIAIDYNLYNEVNYHTFLGGFDKKLQAHIVKQVDRIAFAPDAILYDEKISSGQSLEKQRTRWISSYFKYFKDCFSILSKGIRKLDFNLIYFGFNTLRPPLFIVLAVSALLMFVSFFVDRTLFYVWLFGYSSFFFSFILIVLIKGKDINYLKTMLLLPLFFFRQVRALLQIRKARKSFLKTEHSKVIYIEEAMMNNR
jgi:cellulose synthase/poly-beta-1,6-N-acetylglucosamine synthase-like glycosyltransferase